MTRFIHTNTHVMWNSTDQSDELALCVSYPLMHHAYDEQKMIAVHHPDDVRK